MNKDKLIEQFFEKLLKYADGAEKFTSDNAPLYIEELLTFGKIEASFGLLSSLLLLVLSISIAIVSCLVFESEVVRVASFVFGAPAFVISSIYLPCNFLTLQKIKHAPRVYIMEQLRK